MQDAFLHQRAAADLADRLEAIPRPFEAALDLGGGGAFSHELRKRTDLATRVRIVCRADVAGAPVLTDLDRLPFAAHSFDLIVSPLALHWANDLAGALIQARAALKPDGLLLASLFGGETLKELRLCLLEAEAELTGGAAPRIAPFAQLQDIAGLLQRAGFALPAADRDMVTVRYAEPFKLLADLRAMGETALFAERPQPLNRAVLMRAMALYRQRYADADGRVRASFELLTATGWRPHASQQRPLKPGSAQARLADALGVQERSAGEKPP